jgi:hypothetical protein
MSSTSPSSVILEFLVVEVLLLELEAAIRANFVVCF